jgi:hypothetical protein
LPGSKAASDSNISFAIGNPGQLVRDIKPNVDIRMLVRKNVEPCHQPVCGEHLRCGDHHDFACTSPAQFGQAYFELIKAGADFVQRRSRLAYRSQSFVAGTFALQKRIANPLFEGANELSYRGGRYAQFRSCSDKAAVSSRRLEGLQRLQPGQ